MSGAQKSLELLEQELAQNLIHAFTRELQRLGYDYVSIAIARRLDEGSGKVSGACSMRARPCVVSSLPHQASVLRSLASQCDAIFAQSDVPEATEGYIEDVSRPNFGRGAMH